MFEIAYHGIKLVDHEFTCKHVHRFSPPSFISKTLGCINKKQFYGTKTDVSYQFVQLSEVLFFINQRNYVEDECVTNHITVAPNNKSFAGNLTI